MIKIFGIGVDIARNSRFENLLQKSHKTRFLSRVLHSKEIEDFHTNNDLKSQARYLASRFFLGKN